MRSYSLITSANELGRIASEVIAAFLIGLDIETYNPAGGGELDPRKGKVRLLQLNLDDKAIYVIDLMRTGTLGPLVDALRKTKGLFVIHNVKFEQKWLWHHYQIELWPAFCTFRASALLNNGKGLSNKIDDVIERELGEKVENTGQGDSDWSKPNLDKIQLDYAAEDVMRLPTLYKGLRAKLKEFGMLQTALIEFGACLPEGAIELRGFPVDRRMWTELADANTVISKRLKEELIYELPHPTDQLALPGMNGSWNLNSNQQMLKSLRKLGLTSKVDGQRVPLENTSSLSLAPHALKEPVVKKLLDYRHAVQRVKTFGLDWLKWIEEDGRVHADFFGLLVSGRYSCSNPNLQQIPRDAAFRRCFRAPNGRVFVLADYAGIEMRLVAEIADDGTLIRVFVLEAAGKGPDAHYATASLVAGKPVSKITKDERQQAKAVNFGFIYGMGPEKFTIYALANYGVVIPLSKAKRFHQRYFENYDGIARWHRRMLRDGQRTGISRTLSGRMRYLDPQKSFNEFYNTPVQGTGADALKLSMRNVHYRLQDPKYGGRAFLCHMVHDELIVECDDDPEMIEAVKVDLEEGMREGMSPFLKKVPIVVDANAGPSWAEAK